MIDLDSLLSSESEDYDLEVKAAQGTDGQGEVPRALWESYSAMANTQGGTIILGVGEQEDGTYAILGLNKPNKVRKEFWDSINNRRVVSANLLSDAQVLVFEHGGKSLIRVEVPRADRAQRPVYVGQNPLTGTYRRNYEGDYKCDEETARRMLAEAIQPARDSVLLDNYTLDDLNADTIAAFRNDFKSTNPNHPWVTLDDCELLRNLGGWKKDRSTAQEGVTLAGLLMFGKLRTILEAVPNYVVDYQEREKPPTNRRWLDRVTTDGSWSGNLYDFYRKVFPKLTSDLKVPFRRDRPGKRIDEDNIHEALREAIVNALIHADFSGRVPILIIKRPDMFGFRNPGELRLPLSVVLAGGTSDCRNRSLQKMFQMVGAAEQAGSGFPKIKRAWGEQHWRPPLLTEGAMPEHTVLRLTMLSLLPQEVLDELDRRYGARFRTLGEIERLALATASVEGKVTTERLKAITGVHGTDLTAMFRKLVDADFLEPEGVGRGTCYYLPGSPIFNDDVNNDVNEGALSKTGEDSEHLPNIITDSSEHISLNSELLTSGSEHLSSSSEHLGLDSEHLLSLEDIAKRVREAGKVSKTTMIDTIIRLCRDEFIPLKQMAQLLGRSSDTIRVHYLSGMVRDGQLEPKYPNKINHPGQAYKAKGLTEEESNDTTRKAVSANADSASGSAKPGGVRGA